MEVPSPQEEARSAQSSQHLDTIKEEAEISAQLSTPERSPRKTPSYRGSAKYVRHGEDDDDGEDEDDDIVDVEEEDSFELLDIGPDDEYDTDLEMDIDQWLLEGRVQLQNDLSGERTYNAACETVGVTAASYFVRHMHDREVVMRFHGLGPLGVKAMCAPLKSNDKIEKLDLEGNWIQEMGCVSVADMLSENIYLSDLILSENKIGSEGAIALCQILLKNDMINKLDLSGNDLTDSAAEAICGMLKKNTTLKHLILRHNYFEDRGAFHFKEALSTNESLETIDLSWNRFRTRSAMMIAEGIQENYGLRCLNFAMNGLGQEGAECMGRALKTNRTLLQLDISFNRIPERGAGFIALGLQVNDVLQGLKISSNPIGSEGALVLLLALDRNDSSCLNYLELQNIRVNEEFKELEHKLKLGQELICIHAGFKYETSIPETQKIEPDDWWVRDPMTKLRKYIRDSGYRLIDLFRDFDKDGNNTISREEFILGVQQAGIHLTEDQVDELIRKLDKDKNGEIDYVELIDGDREYRALRRQWAESKRKKELEMIDKSPRQQEQQMSVRDMLDQTEVLVPDTTKAATSVTDTGTDPVSFDD
nr:hypothetical protein BaRGS_035131 [Batillaria attramentaria]